MNADLFALLSHPIAQRLGWTLIHSLWQGVVIAAALAVVLRALKTAPSNLRYIASSCAMGMLVIAAIFTFTQVRVSAVGPTDVALAPQRIGANPPIAPKSFAPAVPLEPLPEMSSEPSHRELSWIVLLWFVGVIALSLWNIGGWVSVFALRWGQRLERWEPTLLKLIDRLKIRRAVRLIESARIDVPAVIGAFRPVIVVPIGIFSGLSPQQVEAILAHELAHVRRWDYGVNLLQSAVETLVFYHPATWWISAQIRRERENCCDDIAAGVCPDERAYASALAALEARRSSISLPLALSATDGNLLDRVRRLLRLPSNRRPSRIHSLAAAALAIACVAVPLIVTAQQSPPAKSETAPAATTATTAPSGGDIDNVSPIQPDDLKAVVEDYRTGPSDLLSVSITGLVAPGVETVKTARVSESGLISLPIVGEVAVKGLTAPEAEKAIQKAYVGGNVLKEAQVSVSVSEARQRLFTILGDVEKPGLYVISQSDFRVLDALTIGGARTGGGQQIRVVRKADKRVLDIHWDKLAAGDLSENVVLRPGDMVIVAPVNRTPLKVVIGKESLYYEGKPIDIAGLEKMLNKASEAQRRTVYLEMAASAPDVTVERFFNASGELSNLAKKLHLAYVSETGIQPTTEPAAPETGEYYMDGHIQRSGVYSISGQKITLKQAIVAAGGLDEGATEAYLDVIRRIGENAEEYPAQNLSVNDLFEGKVKDFYLRPNDVIRVSLKPIKHDPHAATRPAPAILSPPPDGKQQGQYYLGGEVLRVGVYSLSRKLTVRQAIFAGGGVKTDGNKLLVTAIRRDDNDQEHAVMDKVPADELIGGKTSDMYVWPDDLIRLTLRPGVSPPPTTAPHAAVAPVPTTSPAAGASGESNELSPRVLRIAQADPTMREYVQLFERYKLRFESLKQKVGPNVRVYQDAADDLRIQQQRINAYADQYEKVWAMAETDSLLRKAQMQRMEQAANLEVLKQRYATSHPSVINTEAYLKKLDNEIARLQSEQVPNGAAPTSKPGPGK